MSEERKKSINQLNKQINKQHEKGKKSIKQTNKRTNPTKPSTTCIVSSLSILHTPHLSQRCGLIRNDLNDLPKPLTCMCLQHCFALSAITYSNRYPITYLFLFLSKRKREIQKHIQKQRKKHIQ